MAVSSQCPFRTLKSTGNSLVPGAQKSWESEQRRAMSQSCPGDSLRCISVVSASDYSNLLFPLLLCRRSGSGRSLWQPCRGSLLARACVSPEVSRGGFPGCALASLLCFPSNHGKGSRNPGCSLRGPGWVRAGAVLPREPPVRELSKLLFLESRCEGVTFAFAAGRWQRINRAVDFPLWEPSRPTGFCPVTLSVPACS